MHEGRRYSAPYTFGTKGEANEFLASERTAIINGTWMDFEMRERFEQAQREAEERMMETFFSYASRWIETRTNNQGKKLSQGVKDEYLRYIKSDRLSYWADYGLFEITVADVREWYSDTIQDGKLTSMARNYTLMKSVMDTAVEDGIIPMNPCKVRGGGSASTGKDVDVPTSAELDAIIAALPVKYFVIAVVAIAGGLRYGEIVALRTTDVDVYFNREGEVDCVRIRISRSITHTKYHGRVEGPPKSAAGVRSLYIYGEDAVTIAAYVDSVDVGQRLWSAIGDPEDPMPYHTFKHNWDRARKSIHSTATVHSMRHYSGTKYAQVGATLKEVMARLGHSTPSAALRYQHSGERDGELAKRVARKSA